MKRTIQIGLLTGLLAGAAQAGSFETKLPFAFDQWIDIASTDGPATLHRLRLVRASASTKSRIMRPSGSEYLQDVQIQLEFSNDATRDWDARLRVEWLDEKGVAIDGYNGRENLDSESRHDQATVTLSTLRYGLERARTLTVRIDFDPE
jgi:hypothetical protein